VAVEIDTWDVHSSNAVRNRKKKERAVSEAERSRAAAKKMSYVSGYPRTEEKFRKRHVRGGSGGWDQKIDLLT